ncbi:hypothetical protein AOC05_11910 [Arthrobacter alpinus]|uniref:DUF1877 domain-containing protein n=1 Tax=Arthrobacter alpinus TaxID=656366 RepID=A0A0M4QNE5_9MICC|nr:MULTISPECIES: DUF1877 family protein [Arthrobacter]ALE92834.1 hypothetical protein AOC05_11910 [Arthrobacter alpinus]
MGIRYFALPVPAQLVTIARINPRAFLSDQHFWETWSDPPDRPEGLDLDKAWRDLQQLLGGMDSEPMRDAYELVRGEVTHYGYGWIPYDRVLSAEEVLKVASDLAVADLARLYQEYTPQVSPDWAAIMDGRRDYVESYLEAARKFTTELAGMGLGLIYSIG